MGGYILFGGGREGGFSFPPTRRAFPIKRAVLQQRYERRVNQRMRKYLGAPLAPPPTDLLSEDPSESSTVELDAADGRTAGDLLASHPPCREFLTPNASHTSHYCQ